MIPVNQPLLDGNEKKYLIECIDSGWISSEGPFVARFEEQFAARVGRRHGVAVCNGTP
jgi:perosamine synthetase